MSTCVAQIVVRTEGIQGPPGLLASVLQANVFLTSAVPQTIYAVPSARYAFRVDGLYNLKCDGGNTMNVTLAINGVPVTGLNNVTANSTRQDLVATGANTVNVNDEVTIILSGEAWRPTSSSRCKARQLRHKSKTFHKEKARWLRTSTSSRHSST